MIPPTNFKNVKCSVCKYLKQLYFCHCVGGVMTPPYG